MTTFCVFGDYALTSEKLFSEFETLEEAVGHAEGLVDCGFSGIEVIRFADDGEAITEYDLRD